MYNDQRRTPNLLVAPHKEATFPPPSGPDSGTAEKRSLRETPEAAQAPSETPDSITAEEYEKLTDPEKWQILVKAFRLNRRTLLSLPRVTAVDIGYRIKDGVFQDELALRIHVERKIPEESKIFERHPYSCIPGSGAKRTAGKYFQLKKYDVPTDVIEGDYGPVHVAGVPRPGMVLEKPRNPNEVNRRRRLNPLVGGISIGSPLAPSGTLGALVWDNTDGSVCILSHWQILSGDPRAEAGIPCFQPGRLDQGRSSDVVGLLKRWSFEYQTDAAIAELTGSRHYCAGEILSLTQQITGETDPHLGMLLQKYGRSTGFTWGFIDGLYFSTAIEYNNGIMQVFEDQIHIAPAEPGVRISEPGDSGSVWVTKTENEGFKAVGLHFAGDLPHSAFGEYALANPMSIVMSNLNVSFRPRFLEIRDEDVLTPVFPSLQLVAGAASTQPVGIVGSDRLRRSSGQPDPVEIKPTGGG
jgi:endonuclease G